MCAIDLNSQRRASKKREQPREREAIRKDLDQSEGSWAMTGNLVSTIVFHFSFPSSHACSSPALATLISPGCPKQNPLIGNLSFPGKRFQNRIARTNFQNHPKRVMTRRVERIECPRNRLAKSVRHKWISMQERKTKEIVSGPSRMCNLLQSFTPFSLLCSLPVALAE